jgi:hypothetical protein
MLVTAATSLPQASSASHQHFFAANLPAPWPLLLGNDACYSTAARTMTAAVIATVTPGCGRGCEGRGRRRRGKTRAQVATPTRTFRQAPAVPCASLATYAHIGRCLLGLGQVRRDLIVIRNQNSPRFLVLSWPHGSDQNTASAPP